MKLRKSIGYRFNLGDYESLYVSAEVEVDSQLDFDKATPPSDEDILSYLDELLQAAISDEIAEAAELAPDDSVAHHLLTDKFHGKAT